MKRFTVFILGVLCLACFCVPTFAYSGHICSPRGDMINCSEHKINYIYPTLLTDIIGTVYPGGRGANQLVIYTRDYGRNTGTNEYGTEATVIGETVVKISGANSTIPSEGYVISGHGTAKKWMMDNIKIGTKIWIDEEEMTLTAYTTVDSYRFLAEEKIREAETMIRTSRPKLSKYEQENIQKYLKRAKQYVKRTGRSDEKSIFYAKKAIEMADQVLYMSLPYIQDELKGVWVRPVETSRTQIERTLDEMQRTGINAIFLETFFHGKTIFPSTTMKEYGFVEQNEMFNGFDPLEIWTQEAHKRNIKVHIWFQSFYVGNKPIFLNDKTILSVKPEWANRDKANYNSIDIPSHKSEHSGYFLDPANPEVTRFLEELLREISTRYCIDGINLDYVRYPTSAKPSSSNYEMSNWGYTQIARDEFKSIYNVDPIDVAYNSPLWNSWARYRQQKVSNYVERIASIFQDKGITVSAVVFPYQENGIATKQQNWEYWTRNGSLNALTPLILTADHELSTEIIKGIKRNVSPDTKIYTGIFIPFMDGETDDLIKQYHMIRAEKLNGIIIFDWAHFGRKYKEVLKSSAFLSHEIPQANQNNTYQKNNNRRNSNRRNSNQRNWEKTRR